MSAAGDLPGQLLQLGDKFGVGAEFQSRLDDGLHDLEPQHGEQFGLTVQPTDAGKIGKRRTAPQVERGVVYYTQNNGQIGGFDAAGCGETLCFPLWSTVTQPVDAFMTTPVIVNGRLYVAGPAVNGRPTMWVYRLTT